MAPVRFGRLSPIMPVWSLNAQLMPQQSYDGACAVRQAETLQMCARITQMQLEEVIVSISKLFTQ